MARHDWELELGRKWWVAERFCKRGANKENDDGLSVILIQLSPRRLLVWP